MGVDLGMWGCFFNYVIIGVVFLWEKFEFVFEFSDMFDIFVRIVCL